LFARVAAEIGAGSLLHTDMRQTGEAPHVAMIGRPVRPPVTVNVIKIRARLHPGKHPNLPEIHARPAVRTVDPFAVGLRNERPNRIAGPGITPERRQGSAQPLGIVPGPGVAGG